MRRTLTTLVFSDEDLATLVDALASAPASVRASALEKRLRRALAVEPPCQSGAVGHKSTCGGTR